MHCLDNVYMRTWHCSACNQQPCPAMQTGYGVENQKPVPKIRIHLGLFFVTATKKVDGGRWKVDDVGLENATPGLRPRAAFSRPRSQFFTIRTSQPANNIYILF